MSIVKSHRIPGIIIASVFSVWGMILRFRIFVNRDFWLDEINQLRFTLEPLKPLWLREHPRKDITSFPGDYLLTYPFVKMFGASKLVAIPHAIVTLIGFYLLYLICQRYFKTTFGYLVTFSLMCFNGLLTWHAFEIRPYSVLPTLTLACFYFGKDVIEKGSEGVTSNLKKFLIGLLFVITILFHVYGIYIVFFVLLFHILIQTNEEAFFAVIRRKVKFFFTIGAITFLPWIWFTVAILTIKQSDFDVFEYIPNPFVDVYDFCGTMVGIFIGIRGLYFLLFGMIAAFIIPHLEQYRQIKFFLFLIVFPITCVLASSIIKNYWFLPRQFVWVVPLFCFFLGWCWDSVIYLLRERIASLKR